MSDRIRASFIFGSANSDSSLKPAKFSESLSFFYIVIVFNEFAPGKKLRWDNALITGMRTYIAEFSHLFDNTPQDIVNLPLPCGYLKS